MNAAWRGVTQSRARDLSGIFSAREAPPRAGIHAFAGPAPYRGTAGVALVGLLAVEVVVGLAVAGSVAPYAVLFLLAGPLLYLALRHPTSVAYITLAWLMFEKSAGNFSPGLSTTLSSAGDGLLVVGLVFAITVNLMRRRKPALRFGPVLPGAAAFLAFGLLSIFVNSVSPRVASLGLVDDLRSVLIFLIVITIGISARDVERFVYWVIGVMAFSSVISVLQVIPGSPAWAVGGARFAATGGLMRVDGLFGHPLSNGDYLALTFPLAILLFAVGDVRGRARAWMRWGLAVMALALVLTFARQAWLAIPVSIIAVGVLVERRLLRVAVPATVLLAAAALPFVTSINVNDNGGQRLTLFRLTLPLIRSHLLLGAGPGRYGGHVALVTRTPLYAQYHVSTYFYGTGNQIDQYWTHLLAESGILGVGAFLAMIVAVFAVGRRAYFAAVTPRRRAIILGLLCAAPAAVLLSFASSVLEEAPASALFWSLMGMVTVLALNPETKAPQAVPAGARPQPVAAGT